MSFDQVDLSLPEDFDNVVRLFPLPNLVLFPGVIQALHVFESHYREMVEDALATDRLIAMVLAGPSEILESLAGPKLSATVCLGKIFTHTRLDDGCYNLLLLGIQRGRIVKELKTAKPYRMAEIQIVNNSRQPTGTRSETLRQQVISEFRKLVSQRPLSDEEALDELLQQQLPLGQLLDLVTYSCGAAPAEQQTVLDALDVGKRAEIVLNMLRLQREALQKQNTSAGNPGSDFPPDFSLN